MVLICQDKGGGELAHMEDCYTPVPHERKTPMVTKIIRTSPEPGL